MQHSTFITHIESWLESFGWECIGNELWKDPEFKNESKIESVATAVMIQIYRSLSAIQNS